MLHSISKVSKKLATDSMNDTQVEQPEGNVENVVVKKVKLMAKKRAHEQLADR